MPFDIDLPADIELTLQTDQPCPIHAGARHLKVLVAQDGNKYASLTRCGDSLAAVCSDYDGTVQHNESMTAIQNTPGEVRLFDWIVSFFK